MKMSFRWFGSNNDSVTLQNIKQIPGVNQVVGAIYDIPVGNIWDIQSIKLLKNQIERAGLKLEVIESVNIHEDIKLGLPSRDKYIDNYKQTVRNLAECGIKVICYNFMPVFDWVRTDLQFPLSDGSTDMAFQHKLVEGTPQEIVESVQNTSNDFVLPGWEPERLTQLTSLFESYKGITEENLKENLKYFLDAIIPTCEEVGIKMAIHPDDPPMPIFGLPRIVKNRDNLNDIIQMIDSPSNGLTICTGSLGENPNNDVPSIIKEFVQKDRVPFIHARNIKFMNNGDFHETAHLSDEGSLDMYEIIHTLVENDYDGYIRPDHGRTIWNETARPGYGLYDRALGSQYLSGLIEACTKQSNK